MTGAPAYQQTLRNLNEALRQELAALDSGDVAALESSTASKLAAISALQLSPLVAPDDETEALIHEGAALCEQAALRVNLLRSEEHTSELQSLMRISYAVFFLKKENSN